MNIIIAGKMSEINWINFCITSFEKVLIKINVIIRNEKLSDADDPDSNFNFSFLFNICIKILSLPNDTQAN